jgi:flavin-binding protein dodecin
VLNIRRWRAKLIGLQKLPCSTQRSVAMSTAKVIEIISSSETSFEDAVEQGVARAGDSLSDVTSAWIKDQSVVVSQGMITEFRVTLKVTFILKGS